MSVSSASVSASYRSGCPRRLEASIGIPGTELATEVVSHWEPNLSLL